MVTILVLSFFEYFATTPFLAKCFDHFMNAKILLVKADTVTNKDVG